ncbi:MAG: hypothetical protein A2Y31_04130 [Spirochaetes bacterium GWC2_52_13]|nr:MAG: hypothetical protein A2Y31_04130 [Spirochaetes bacterium GWC2_52_13]HCG63240.1 hypothetical protein [Sphaerochaeta sp.]
MDDYIEYLERLGIRDESTPKRVKQILDFYKEIYSGEEPKFLFVSEFLNGDGKREYTSLILFYNDIICEAKNFRTEYNLDANQFDPSTCYWNFKLSNIPTCEQSEIKSAYLNFYFSFNMSLELKATDDNCQNLLEIFNYYCKKKEEN